MNSTTKLVLKPDFTFQPSDFIPVKVGAGELCQHAPQPPLVRQTSLDLAPPPEKPAKPWEAANPRVKVPFVVRLPEAAHLQLAYLVQHVPNVSMHSLVLRAIQEQNARMLSDLEKKSG